MLVLENIDPEMAKDGVMLTLFDASARNELAVKAGTSLVLGERYIVDSEEGPTKSVVWDVLDVRTPA